MKLLIVEDSAVVGERRLAAFAACLAGGKE